MKVKVLDSTSKEAIQKEEDDVAVQLMDEGYTIREMKRWAEHVEEESVYRTIIFYEED